MKWIQASASVLVMLFATTASAVPIIFSFDGTVTVGGTVRTDVVYTPDFPIVGSGEIDFDAGTGTLFLPDYSFTIDAGIQGPDGLIDAALTVTGWAQTITAVDDLGNITSTGAGTVSCTVTGGLGGFICPQINANPTVAGWPPADGAALGSSAVIDALAQTILVIDNSNAQAGTVTTSYSYSIVPEPGTALLLGLGLVGLAGRRARGV